MFTAAILVPSPPLLVPELTGAAAAETAPLRDAVQTAAKALSALATEWVAVGAAPAAVEVRSDAQGTYRGYGIDVRVALRPGPAGDPDPDLPLAALTAGWIRGTCAPDAVVDARILAADLSPHQCAEYGAELRALLDRDPEPRGLVIVADGANTLTAKAPGAFDPRAEGVQARIDAALDTGDRDALLALEPAECDSLGIGGRVPWQVLAGVFDAPPASCRTLYSAAPYGVGYHVGEWRP
ncbi:class III extradiol dioxygenase subunit B-like domain-containing protein [Rhodococcus opacus]|uniref:class III extradiol dioxygenase subunit B-like domain-containing protein n=1 Tax=Rhodococcus opacus TaxID=37919 RepID=UPI00155B1CF1|nr:class III extradiol dioxygenase subunit B-like domain-containing protein [Rhodococcus opacus]